MIKLNRLNVLRKSCVRMKDNGQWSTWSKKKTQPNKQPTTHPHKEIWIDGYFFHYSNLLFFPRTKEAFLNWLMRAPSLTLAAMTATASIVQTPSWCRSWRTNSNQETKEEFFFLHLLKILQSLPFSILQER